MHSFTFNGHSSDEFGIRIERFPDLNRSERKYRSASVSGRNGNIYQMQDAWEEVTVSYQIFAGERQAGAAVSDFTDIVEWLNSADDYAVLTDTYDPTHYRLAVFVDELEIESQWHTFGKATVRFRCKPQRYLVQNDISVNNNDSITNPTNHIALPIITLTGNGDTYNRLSLVYGYSINTTQNDYAWNNEWLNTKNFMFVLDQRNVSYGTPWYAYSVMYSTAHSAGASITTADNSTGTLAFTPCSTGGHVLGVGIGLELAPDTDYTISCNTSSGNSEILISVFESEGAKKYVMGFSGEGNNAGSITVPFHVPANCSYVLVSFHRGANDSGTFSSIMLASGNQAKPFIPYTYTETDSSFSINDTTLTFKTKGFDKAVIDCEKEDFTVDGVNSNSVSAIKDQYGNVSPEYLELKKGANVISWSGGITAVSINQKTWDL